MKTSQKKDERVRSPLITEEVPFQYGEAYKSLRTNLQFLSLDKTIKKILVTSSIPGEGKTTVAINLAISLAQLGHKVLLIDCDLRKPYIHKYLRMSGLKNGVTTALNEKNPLENCITHFTDLGIYVMPCGPIPPNPAEILSSNLMLELVTKLEKQFDFIVFDTPPVSVVSDAAIISKFIDGVAFVLRQHYTTSESALMAKKSLENVGANILGCIFNGYDIRKTNKSGEYQYYKKYYKYEE
jgi:capsular exopolysaccharide synthesis family protein